MKLTAQLELPIGTSIALRDLDVDVLSRALELEADDVTRRLQGLMRDEDTIARDQSRIRRRMLLPLVGVVIAAVAGGALLLVSDAEDRPGQVGQTAPADEAARQVAPQPSANVATDLGAGGAVLENPDVVTDIGTAAVEQNDD